MSRGDNRIPMSDAERAERVRRLEELRALAQRRHQDMCSDPSPEVSVPGECFVADNHNVAISDASSDDAHQQAEDEFCDLVEDHIKQQQQQRYTSDKCDAHLFHGAEGDDETWQRTVVENSSWRRREIGDFELLRLAKMGDKVSYDEFSQMSGIDCTTFVDNMHRNSLHYAADGGNVELIASLIQRGVPFMTDEKGLTPLDIAILNGHSDTVLSLLKKEQDHIATPSRVSAVSSRLDSTSSTSSYRSVEQLLALFAPKPPLFVLSKPAEAVPVTTRARCFWVNRPMKETAQVTMALTTASEAATVSGDTRHNLDSCVSSLSCAETVPSTANRADIQVRTEVVSSETNAETSRAVMTKLMNEARRTDGLRDWLAPVLPAWQHRGGEADHLSTGGTVIIVRAYNTADDQGEDSSRNKSCNNVVGVLVGCVLEGVLTYPLLRSNADTNSTSRVDVARGDNPEESSRTKLVVVANYLAVHPSHGGSGVAVAMMEALGCYARSLLGQGDQYSARSHVCPLVMVMFSTSSPLPQPPHAVCMLKWYSRVLRVRDVFAQDYASDILPDFFRYDTTLRADAVLRGTVPEKLCTQYYDSVQEWVQVETSDTAQITEVRTFLWEQQQRLENHLHSCCARENSNTRAKASSSSSTSAGMEMLWCPSTDEQVRRCMCEESSSRLYLRRSAGIGAAARNVITDVVFLRLRHARSSHQTTTMSGAIAQVSFALFTTLSGTAKVQHVLLLAHMREKAAVLLVPTCYGFTESDLAKSNFEEVSNGREFVYAVDPFNHVRQVVSPIPSTKIFSPLLFC